MRELRLALPDGTDVAAALHVDGASGRASGGTSGGASGGVARPAVLLLPGARGDHAAAHLVAVSELLAEAGHPVVRAALSSRPPGAGVVGPAERSIGRFGEILEAARMDGASALSCFIHITLPLMRPVIIVAVLLRLIFALKTFDIIFIMTKGGPGTATDLVSYFIYRAAFFGLDIGRAAAMSVALLVFVIALTTYLYRYMRSLR